VEWAREAVAGGADALAMAGGDGSQAIVAAVAAEHELPYACTADRYVRLTVLFALVLFMVAAGQPFKQRPVRDRCECARVRLAHLHPGFCDHLASGVAPRIVR
jgi:hypothetical protein